MKTALLIALAVLLAASGCPGLPVENASANGGAAANRYEAVLGQLADSDPDARQQAFDLLRRDAPNALRQEALRLAAHDAAEAEVRLFAVDACARLGIEEAAPVLIGILKNDPPAALREAAEGALARLTGNRWATAAEWETWWDENKHTSRDQWLLARIDRFRDQTRRQNEQIATLSRRLATYIVADYREQLRGLREAGANGQIVPLLAEALKEPLAAVKIFALTELGRCGDPHAIEAIEPHLADTNVDIRVAAVSAMTALAADGTAGRLEALLRDESPRVRQAAITGLGRLGGQEARPEIERLLRDRDEDVASAAARALGDMGDIRSAPALVDVLPSPHEKVRWFAAMSLGRLKAADAVEPLMRAYGAEALPGVQQAIVAALGDIGRPEALPVLRDAFDNPTPEVRAAAWESIKKIDVGAFDLAEGGIGRQLTAGQSERAIELFEMVSQRYGKEAEYEKRMDALTRRMIEVYLGQDKPMQALTLIRQLALADEAMDDRDMHLRRLALETEREFAEVAAELAERLAQKWPAELFERLDTIERITGLLLEQERPRKAVSLIETLRRALPGNPLPDAGNRLAQLADRALAVQADTLDRHRQKATALIGRLGGPENGNAAAEELQRLDVRVVAECLVAALEEAEEIERRQALVKALRRATAVEEGLGYDPEAPDAERAEAIGRWKAWIEARRW